MQPYASPQIIISILRRCVKISYIFNMDNDNDTRSMLSGAKTLCLIKYSHKTKRIAVTDEKDAHERIKRLPGIDEYMLKWVTTTYKNDVIVLNARGLP